MNRMCSVVVGLSFLSFSIAEAEDYSESMKSGVFVKVTWTSEVAIGTAIPWTLSISNASSTNHVCGLSLGIDAVGEDRNSWGYVFTATSNVSLTASSGTNFTFTIPASSYGSKPNGIFRGTAALEIDGTNDFFLHEGFTSLHASSNALSVNPEQGAKVGDPVLCNFSFQNPYPFALTGVVVTIKGKNLFTSQQEFHLGTVLASQSAQVSTNPIAVKAGTGTIYAGITASNLSVFIFRRSIQVDPR